MSLQKENMQDANKFLSEENMNIVNSGETNFHNTKLGVCRPERSIDDNPVQSISIKDNCDNNDQNKENYHPNILSNTADINNNRNKTIDQNELKEIKFEPFSFSKNLNIFNEIEKTSKFDLLQRELYSGATNFIIKNRDEFGRLIPKTIEHCNQDYINLKFPFTRTSIKQGRENFTKKIERLFTNDKINKTCDQAEFNLLEFDDANPKKYTDSLLRNVKNSEIIIGIDQIKEANLENERARILESQKLEEDVEEKQIEEDRALQVSSRIFMKECKQQIAELLTKRSHSETFVENLAELGQNIAQLENDVKYVTNALKTSQVKTNSIFNQAQKKLVKK